MRFHTPEKTIRKFIAAALAAVLAFSLIPAAALASPAATGRLRFLCRDSAGYVCPGVALALYADEAMTAKAGEGTSDSAGIVELSGLGTATYWVTVTAVPRGFEKPDVRIPVEAVDGKATDYNLVFQKTGIAPATSGGSTLKSLTAAGSLSPAFAPGTKSYSLKLDEGTAKTTIRAAASNASAKVYINGRKTSSRTVTLQPGGKATVRIQVKLAGGKSTWYTVRVSRAKSTNAELSGIAASSGKLSPGFNAGVTEYTLTLPATQCWLKIKPKLASRYASYTITVDGRRAGTVLTMKSGATKTMRITVRSQAGNKKTYIIKITRPVKTAAK